MEEVCRQKTSGAAVQYFRDNQNGEETCPTSKDDFYAQNDFFPLKAVKAAKSNISSK